jgi:hypothetical protein
MTRCHRCPLGQITDQPAKPKVSYTFGRRHHELPPQPHYRRPMPSWFDHLTVYGTLIGLAMVLYAGLVKVHWWH